MPVDFRPRDLLPGHLQGDSLCFGTLPLTHDFTFQDTGPTSAYPGHYPRPWLLRASSSPVACGWYLLRGVIGLPEGQWGLLRSQLPLLASLGRCSPPGVSAVHTGQYRGLPAPYPVSFDSSVSASYAGSPSRWLNHTFAFAAHRCLLDGIPGLRLPGFRRLSPLQTLEDQSQAWGLRCHSCTWREGLAPSW
jgi:hypothetical protein